MIIDRFEGDCAIIEYNSKFYEIPKELVGNFEEGSVVKIILDDSETKIRKNNIKKLMNDLFE